MVNRVCKFCGKIQEVFQSQLNRPYCSRKCASLAQIKWKVCIVCKRKFIPSRREYNVCSRRCGAIRRFGAKIEEPCPECGRLVNKGGKHSGGKKPIKFCSHSCYGKFMGRLQSSLKLYSELQTDGKRYYLLRIEALKNFKQKSNCERCNGTKDLIMHHRDKNPENNNSENLITVCRACHIKLHRGLIK